MTAQQKWKENNPGASKAQKALYYLRHKDQITEYNKKYYNRKKEEINEQKKSYYQRTKFKMLPNRVIDSGVEAWQELMICRGYFRKENKIKTYKMLNTWYKEFLMEDMKVA